MKARWILITALLAFPFAFAFFLREARLGEKRTARRVFVIPPPLAAPVTAPAAPSETPVEQDNPQSSQSEKLPEPSTDVATTQPPPPIENREPKTVPSEATGSTNHAALLLEGTVTKESDALVYESDAKLQLPNALFLSSPTGVMVSDEQQKTFAGDMQLLSAKQTISANEAILTLQPDGGSILTSKTLSIATNDDSTPTMELKGDNLTLTIPAKKTPAVPPASTQDAPSAPAPTTP